MQNSKLNSNTNIRFTVERTVLMAATLNGVLNHWTKAGERFYFRNEQKSAIDTVLLKEHNIVCEYFINGFNGGVIVKNMKQADQLEAGLVADVKFRRLHPIVCQTLADYLLENC